MENVPKAVLIDAFLTQNLVNVVERYLAGRWADLPRHWDVPFEEIVSEGKRRGIECFIEARPYHEGYWLAKTDRGYSVQFSERGIDSDRRDFPEMESAFRHLLEKRLEYYQLAKMRRSA